MHIWGSIFVLIILFFFVFYTKTLGKIKLWHNKLVSVLEKSPESLVQLLLVHYITPFLALFLNYLTLFALSIYPFPPLSPSSSYTDIEPLRSTPLRQLRGMTNINNNVRCGIQGGRGGLCYQNKQYHGPLAAVK